MVSLQISPKWCPYSYIHIEIVETYFTIIMYAQLPQNPNILLLQMALHSPRCCMHSPQKARESKNEQSVYKHPDPLAAAAAKRMWFM